MIYHRSGKPCVLVRRINWVIILPVIVILSCESTPMTIGESIQGTWKLQSSMFHEKDTSYSHLESGFDMIKIINATHFSFLKHAKNRQFITEGKRDKIIQAFSSFGAGGGSYTLDGHLYMENLEYCNHPNYENMQFYFTAKIEADTLVLESLSEPGSTGNDIILIEKYTRINQ